jgi:hypothetical protein
MSVFQSLKAAFFAILMWVQSRGAGVVLSLFVDGQPMRSVHVQDAANGFVVKGFKFPLIAGCEGSQLDAPQCPVWWQLDVQCFLKLHCDGFLHPRVGEFLNLCLCLMDLW